MSIDIKYSQSYSKVSDCPDVKIPEFAFTGRSNVGKSSLINMLFDRKDLAHVSKQPGKTQSINYFIVNGEYHLVDLPGYGYAKHSKKQRSAWKKMTSDYFLQRLPLVSVFVLVDINLTPQVNDLNMINWFGEHGIPFGIIFTKADKSKDRMVDKNVEIFKNKLLETWEELPPIFLTSSIDGSGRDEVLDYLSNLAAHWQNL
ncbi:ribosome biogenesis GTP-binding protein YihA/YsxC [Membranihabitans marinus]|uniref:ribosome biogenesis GTP-binding protein YihA/YsxC n=1 Tax=Membranihabitans marinus TaxID=1227546 RepID=UPI001F01D9F3|nr:ribosome biogenesis GTP-binding protein YihA/YsxC [Membranihabitans marinus]